MIKEIPGYEGYYACDEEGNVYSLARSITRKDGRIIHRKMYKMKACKSSWGYLHLNLCKDGKLKTKNVHRLIGETFLSVPNDREINHIDGNKLNNNINNLEVCTSSQNRSHAYKLGLRIGLKGCNNPFYYINEETTQKVRNLLKTTNLYQKEIAKIVGISKRSVSRIKLNQSVHKEL